MNLSRNLTIATVAFALMVSLAIAGYELWQKRKAGLQDIEMRFAQIDASSVPSIAELVWHFNVDGLRLVAAGIAKQSDVSRVTIHDAEKGIIDIGKPVAGATVRDFPLTRVVAPASGSGGGVSARVGVLTVEIDRAAVDRRLLADAISRLVSSLLLIALVAGFVLLLLERRVMRHMRRVATYVQQRTSDNLDEGLTLDRPGKSDADELQMLVSGVARMQEKLRSTIDHLKDDIAEREKAEAKVNELAFFDPLTGLPNRRLLLDRLKQTMTTSLRTGTHAALLLIDLDRFKTLNDTLGHDMGDMLLKHVAQRLTACIRAGDTVARLGGDEFVLVLTNLSVSEREAANQTEVAGEKILAVLRQPYMLKEVSYRSTPSIGATLFNGLQTDVDGLLRQADLAMYRSKDAGRDAMRFFDPEMEEAVLKRASLESDLREAIQEQQFLLHYQAQVADGRLTGAEVLVRWQHPRRDLMSPADFIPLAEETGLIMPLGLWVLEAACARLAAWATEPAMAHLTIAVNVSAQQFRQGDFVEKVLAVINATGVNPQRLKLELTESVLVQDVESIIGKMYMLRSKGVGFALDDFGTGYSSLTYLRRLPLDQLKIDQSFVRDLLVNPNDAAIARTIIALAQSLGLGVIAEGVETEKQCEFLAASGCHAYQGYLFGRPLPVESFETFAQQG
jgi:diguanylate cyclase (GGDEF)-like protein